MDEPFRITQDMKNKFALVVERIHMKSGKMCDTYAILSTTITPNSWIK